ncbi:hypothetical protein Tco_0943325 [Tanacetum coccineum]
MSNTNNNMQTQTSSALHNAIMEADGKDRPLMLAPDSLSTMDNEVGVTSPESTTQTLPSFEEYTPPVTYLEEVEKTLGTPIKEMFDNDWGLESKEVSPLGEELSLFDRPNEVERGRIQEARRLELFFNNKFLNVWLLLTTMVESHLLEDKQIPSVGVFDEVFSTWMTFGGNTRDLSSFGEETYEITDLHQDSPRIIVLKAWRRHHKHKATPS